MNYILPFILAFGLSLIITPLVRRFAISRGIVDQPDARRIHTKPTPRLGGVGFFISFLIVVLAYALIAPKTLDFYKAKIFAFDQHLAGVLLGGLVLVIMGAIDDIRSLKPWQKLLGQILAALIVVGSGIGVGFLANPFGGVISLDSLKIPFHFLGETKYIIVWADLLAVFWIVAIINVVNFLDGLDGLAAGVGGIAALILFFLSLTPTINQPATAMLLIIFAGSLLGFLPFNFSPAKIFMGDSGSQLIGFILAVASIISGGKIATAALVLGFPILDGIWVASRRILAKKPFWEADKKHLHHRLLEIGLNQRQAVLFLYVISIIFGTVALFSTSYQKFEAALILFGLMLVLAIILVMIKWERGKGNQSTD